MRMCMQVLTDELSVQIDLEAMKFENGLKGHIRIEGGT